MSNVLPDRERREVWGRYRARFLTAAALVGLSSSLLALAALLPSELALWMNPAPHNDAQEVQADTTDRTTLIRTQSLVSALLPFMSATTTPTDRIESILAQRPSGVSISHITYSSGNPGTITLTGAADTIQHIRTYQETLRSSGAFSSVNVPIADLAGTGGGEFTVTLTGTF